jgi:hypothetical protein
MSNSASLIKLGYRGIAGFFVGLILFVLGITGFALALSGGVILALSWIPLAFPDVVNYIAIEGQGSEVFFNNPQLLTPLLLLIGAVLLIVGFFLIILTYYLGKGAIIVDKEVSSSIDRNFRSKDRISQLERLGSLYERGILTKEQFESEKDILLNPQAHEKYEMID